MAQVKFYRGLKANYNSANYADGIYFATDEHCILMNDTQYGGVDNTMFKGFIKDVDVEGNILSFKKDVDGAWTDVSIKLLEAADESIVLGTIKNGEVNDGSTIKVNVKNVGTDDGLKLGKDGLYVDLTKTTKAITDEVARAKEAEGTNKTAIEQEKDDRVAAINALNAEIKGGDGKFIQSVKEDKGVITAVEADLTATAVAYDKTSDKVIAKATDVSAAIKELDAKVAANKAAELTYKTVKLSTEEVTALADANVKEAYKVVSVTNTGTETTVGEVIKIYKDSSLESIDYVKEDDKKKTGQFLKYVYTLADGTKKTVYVDMSELVDQAEVENGIQAVNGKLSIKLAEGNEADFLTVDAKGLKLSGVKTSINAAQKAVQDNLDAEKTRAKGAEDTIESSVGLATDGSHVTTKGNYTKGATTVVGEIAALDTQVKTNADAIATLNGAATVVGSVAKAVADAKAELLGDAAADYNTLGKLEDKIQALDSKAEAAHTEVKEKTSGHVTVAVADSTDGTHKVVTVSENDIASATALTAETSRATTAENTNAKAITDEKTRAKGAEDTIESSVGLATDGSHVTTKGNYTKAATTVVGEIAALDTQVKTNADGIAENKSKISTLNGSDTVEGSVDNKIKVALTWVEVGA